MKEYADFIGISEAELYRKTDITRGTLSNPSGITMVNIEKFCLTFPEVNTDWLLFGKGEMLRKKLSIDERLQGKNPVYFLEGSAIASAFTNDFHGTVTESLTPYIMPSFDFRKGEFYAIKIEGESMYPTISDGDTVIGRLKPVQDYHNGSIAVLYHKHKGLLCKRIESVSIEDTVLLKSDSPEHQNITASFTELSHSYIQVEAILSKDTSEKHLALSPHGIIQDLVDKVERLRVELKSK